MGPKLKRKSDGPMDKYFKLKKMEDGGSNQPLNVQAAAKPCANQVTSPESTTPLAKSRRLSSQNSLDKKEEELHATHSFEWYCCGKPTTLTCNKAGTVEDVLKRSPQFRENAGKNKHKELVIIRDGKAISSHFPCSLIKNERLTVKYIKAADGQSDQNHGSVQRKGPSENLVMFHVLTNGGKNIMKIMKNTELKREIEEITVYAYKGEKVKQALRRDGRFLSIIFEKNCALSHTSTEVTTEMSNLVDDLDGTTFKIILLNKSSPPESQPGSLDDAFIPQNECESSENNENQDPQQTATAEAGSANIPPVRKAKLYVNTTPAELLFEIPDSKKMLDHLSSQFTKMVKGMKTQKGSTLSRIQNLFRVEYGKNAQMCYEVKMMRKLMELSNSVCQVRVNGSAAGSGFLLFHNFVLTNAHVIKNIYNENTGRLDEKVTAHFFYESLDQTSGIDVEEVAAYEYCPDVSGHMYDWALLQLSADQNLPDVLLKHFGFLPKSVGICIIGHPNGGVKRIDPCVITPFEKRGQVVAKHYHENPDGVVVEGSHYGDNQGQIQLVTGRFFENVAESVKDNAQALTYESCFYFGSSGSPVFDEHCNVVAMHSGGYAYRNTQKEMQSVIEFGYPLSVITEHLILQVVERGRLDVLEKFLACEYARHNEVITNLKKLVESRNLTAFKTAANMSEAMNDDRLKTFFSFICQTEEPVPMDTD